ncbi:MAG: electron transfer flavoprotein subunit alpha/FixB family protein [Trueperaceae bacterium]|nr:electron transfer flavoprotein subunit alpha/FixB family protein [Trueperaceae bacterium]
MSAPVLVWIESTADAPTRASLQAVGAARALAERAGAQVEAVAAGAEAAQAAAAYVPVVHQLDLPQDNQETRTRALVAALEASGARALLLAGTRTSQAVAPRVALRVGGALLEDVTALEADADGVRGWRLTQLQRVSEEIVAEATPVVATVKIGSYEPAEANGNGEVRPLEVAFEPEDARVAVQAGGRPAGAKLALEEAEVVVAAGRGVGSADAVAELVEPLAARLGGVIGATRAVVDAGWRPYEEQIGQTGKTVAPEVYVALGISGAVQHLSGMSRSRRIVAINRDADAPIFKHCDVGVVGDVHEIVPALLAALGDGDD